MSHKYVFGFIDGSKVIVTDSDNNLDLPSISKKITTSLRNGIIEFKTITDSVIIPSINNLLFLHIHDTNHKTTSDVNEDIYKEIDDVIEETNISNNTTEIKIKSDTNIDDIYMPNSELEEEDMSNTEYESIDEIEEEDENKNNNDYIEVDINDTSKIKSAISQLETKLRIEESTEE